jgi:(p)ppGpp synthase/HD superfamily hydrolase
MNVVSAFLSSQVMKMLHKDESLMYQLEDLEIASRVKEPYSFWKKLLQKRQDQSGEK